jgi:hypothetical protein
MDDKGKWILQILIMEMMEVGWIENDDIWWKGQMNFGNDDIGSYEKDEFQINDSGW